jgi:hypothetical protein
MEKVILKISLTRSATTKLSLFTGDFLPYSIKINKKLFFTLRPNHRRELSVCKTENRLIYLESSQPTSISISNAIIRNKHLPCQLKITLNINELHSLKIEQNKKRRHQETLKIKY